MIKGQDEAVQHVISESLMRKVMKITNLIPNTWLKANIYKNNIIISIIISSDIISVSEY
jgi:hypothetical protein